MKMKTLRVAAISTKNLLGRVDENLANHEKWIRRAVNAGAKFIGFPEGSLTGYGRDPEVTLTLGSDAVRRIEALASRWRVTIAVGLNERRGQQIYNTCALIGPDGLLGARRKINCIPAESTFYTSARDFPVFNVAGWRMGVAICADASFFEMFRIPVLQGAQAMFAPHANTLGNYGGQPPGWKRWRKPTWRRFLVDCPLFIIGCNNAGLFEPPVRDNEPSRFCGGAMVLSPRGEVLAESTVRRKVECMVVADLDPDQRPPVPHADVFRPEIVYRRRTGWVLGYGISQKGS